MHREKGDSLADEYVSELWDFTCISVTQNNLQELKEIWGQWNDESLLKNRKCANLFEEADEYNRDE
ncbi:hypothetical protein Goshw_007463 [Gossypium schwendimanii]|uniref:Uncharacterized protein n=1 Tax=Gossypium schwendimanii TaxID=34291 RepID=A0A7J9N455_GOSSC|nr:hypothetical protein [Gossypium schwendimanii]